MMDKMLVTYISTKLRELVAWELILIKEKVKGHSDLGKANMTIFHITVFAGTVGRMVITSMTVLRKGICETTIGTMPLWL